VICIARIKEAPDDRPRRIVDRGTVPWPGLVPASGASNVVRPPCLSLIPHEAVVTIGIKRARDSALRADSITVSALEEAMGSARCVERNDGCLPLVSIRGKDKPRRDQANHEHL
jgi:hypothetical protein